MVVRELITAFGFSLDEAKLKTYETKANQIADGFSRVGTVIGTVMTIAATLGIAAITDIADEWASVEGRVALTTKSVADQNAVLKELYETANLTRQSYTATADLYSKVGRNAEELKMTQTEILALTQDVNKALVVGGGKKAENQAAILQFGQALASGKLQGDELRSIMENAPRLANAIAKGLGVTIGELRQMGEDGELTATKVIAAIRSQSVAIDQEFSKMPFTIGQALTIAGNKFGNFINRIGKETGIFKSIATGIVTVVDWIERGVNRVAQALGGWDPALRMLGILVAALSVAWLAIKWPVIVAGINAIKTALVALARHPIALFVIGIALALDELYTWIQGGDSIIGDVVGSFDEWKVSMQPITDLLNSIWSLISPLISGFIDFAAETNNLRLFFELLLSPLTLTLKLLQGIAKFVGFLRGANVQVASGMDMSMLLPGFSPVTPDAIARSGGNGARQVNQEINVDVNVPPGTPAQQAGFVRDSAEVAYADVGSRIVALEYSATD